MNTAMENILDQLHQAFRRDITVFSMTFLEQTLQKRMNALNILSQEEYATQLAGNRVECELFFNSLNVNFSEFFRNPMTFAVLEQQVIPRLMAERKHSPRKEIRVWSAGCAAGQEVYSLAMILDAQSQEYGSGISFRIFATDIDSDVLDTARAGVFPIGMAKNMPLKYYHHCCTKGSETFTVKDELKAFIDFSIHDLLNTQSISPASSIYGDFDLILCCNLLFYYKPEVQHIIINKLAQALSPAGILVTDEVEAGIVKQNDVFQLMPVDAAIFQKNRFIGR